LEDIYDLFGGDKSSFYPSRHWEDWSEESQASVKRGLEQAKRGDISEWEDDEV